VTPTSRAEPTESPVTEARTASLLDALRAVYDPCCQEKGISIVDMGLVKGIEVHGSHVSVQLILTSGWCPFVASIAGRVADSLSALEGVNDTSVQVVWDEPWTPDRLSPEARAKLRFLPPPAQIADRAAYVRQRRASTAPSAVDGSTMK
jgi:metal-sulfur cluster biosynthetic enzyme